MYKVKKFFEKYFDNILIVAYIRSPKAYIESAFQEIAKGGNNKFNIENSYPEYQENFEKFDKIFGCNNVLLWKFESKKLKDGDVVKDFCSRLNLKIDEENIVRSNESMSKEVLSLIYSYNKFGDFLSGNRQINRKENVKLINLLSNMKGHKLKFSSSLILPILEKNGDDILWMEKRLGSSLSEPLEDNASRVNSEEDLLQINISTIQELKKIIGKDSLGIRETASTQEIVRLLDILKKRTSNDSL